MHNQDQEKTQAQRLSYILCHDIEEVRYFYKDLIGLGEISYRMGRHVIFQSGSTELVFCKSDPLTPLGEANNEATPRVWRIEIAESLYLGVINRLKQSVITTLHAKPQWMDAHWGVYLHDPAGNPIELYTIPREVPTVKVWEDHSILNELG